MFPSNFEEPVSHQSLLLLYSLKKQPVEVKILIRQRENYILKVFGLRQLSVRLEFQETAILFMEEVYSFSH